MKNHGSYSSLFLAAGIVLSFASLGYAQEVLIQKQISLSLAEEAAMSGRWLPGIGHCR
jgi:hypothetical protein